MTQSVFKPYFKPTETSGCKALEGCEKKDTCLRYTIYQKQTPYKGWSAFMMCRVSEYVDKDFQHYIEDTQQ